MNQFEVVTIAFRESYAKRLGAVLACFACLLEPLACRCASAAEKPVNLRFTDSTTGFGLRPETVRLEPLTADGVALLIPRARIPRSGRIMPALGTSRYQLTVVAPDYAPIATVIDAALLGGMNLEFKLDPLHPPEETRPEIIYGLRREGFTLIQGFVSDEASGNPMAGVAVSASPSDVHTRTDARGFFRFHVPVPNESEATTGVSLTFRKHGFRVETRRNLELWSGGDWTYRVRLRRGEGMNVLDENTERRRVPKPPPPETEAKPSKPTPEELKNLLINADARHLMSTAPSNATVRVPRNIRVLTSSGVIEYVSLDYYCKHVLPAEWIASWGNIPGGSNCLSAGAIAARCYAVAKLNAVSGTSIYDICGTTSCQVYGTATSANTDTACNFTANYVVINGTSIPSTEYSAENNSAGFGCGDGYTQPTGGCIYDPVCAGETRSGHGRGMCQWGTAKWATGRKMPGQASSNTTPNGYPRQDWRWIVQHYYPNFTLVKAAPLVVGDDIKALKTLDVRACGDGSISSGTNCGLVTTKVANATGTILNGPIQVSADGCGFTWYRVQWSDGTVGWSVENFLERVYSTPVTLGSLSAAPAGTTQINLSWINTDDLEAGYKIERALSAGGPWMEINSVAANVTTFSDRNLYPGSTWFYRIRAYNAGGSSAYTAIATATTGNTPIALPPIGNQNVNEGELLTISNSASADDFVKLITDFENFTTESTNALPLFRNPRFSGSTSGNLAATPDFTIVTDAYPTNGHGPGRVLRVSCNFTNAVNPWLRLTTSGATSWPNPVIRLTKKLRFDIWCDKPVRVGLGCRETSLAADTVVGANGGTSGGIEWVGVTNLTGGVPQPNRTIAASNWTTLAFDLPTEPVVNFSGGNGVLSTASGLGVLEHLAIVPLAGIGTYNLYLDNFAVNVPRVFTYELGPGAPAGADIDPQTGVFAWRPTEDQGPLITNLAILAIDDSSPSLSTTQWVTVTVAEVNSAPVLAGIADRTVHAGGLVAFTNSATDADWPANALSYSLEPGAPPSASIGAISGVFSWYTTDADSGATHDFTVRVTDNGIPALSDAKSFAVTVMPRPSLKEGGVVGGDFVLAWSAIPGVRYRVQVKDALEDENWHDLLPEVAATGATAGFHDPLGMAQRFYRILVIEP